MRIATWNVNSIKMRANAVRDWLAADNADVLCLQEIKCETGAFPADLFAEIGFESAVLGQKSYNGVALLSRLGLEDVRLGLPGNAADEQARYVEALVQGVRIGCLYLPNGNPADDPVKYPYKLEWMQRLHDHALSLMAGGGPRCFGAATTTLFPQKTIVGTCRSGWTTPCTFCPTRQAFRRLVYLGLTDAFRAIHPNLSSAYSFWDYQKGRWHRGEGIRH